MKFKYLWILGFFTAFLGNGGEYQVLFKQIGLVANQTDSIVTWHNNLNAILPKLDLSFGNVAGVVIYLLIAFAFLAVFLSVCIASFSGLIKGSALASNNEKLTIRNLWKLGYNKFWPILGLVVLGKVIVYSFLALVLVPLMMATFTQGHTSLNALIILLTFLAFIPLTIIVSLATKYASAYVMLENNGFWESFKNGWRLFAANWLVSLEMALVLFFINIATTIILLALASLFLALPFFFGVFHTIDAPNLFDILMNFGVSLIILTSIFIGAGLAVFQTSAWTLLYLRLNTGVKAYSKIVRWAAGLPGKFKKDNSGI